MLQVQNVRLFVGVPVVPSPALAAAMAELPASARATPPGKPHLTLRFLGEVADPEPVAAALREALAGVPAVAGRVVGVGAFPDARRARIAWAGVAAAGLGEVAARVRGATRGVGQPEERSFAPHVTLARLAPPRSLGAWCARHADADWGPFAAGAVVLYRSLGGAYEALARVPLSAAPGPAPQP